MRRLTNKDGTYSELLEDRFGTAYGVNRIDNVCSKKLSLLENFEEELGVDLIVLFNALKNGIFYKGVFYKDTGVVLNWHKCSGEYEDLNEYSQFVVNYSNKCFDLLTVPQEYSGDDYEVHTTLYFADYGKTWALTKEELN